MDYNKYFRKTEHSIISDEIQSQLYDVLGINKFYELGRASTMAQIKVWFNKLKETPGYGDVVAELSAALDMHLEEDKEFKNMVDRLIKDCI
jgi:hypothetical protein